MRLPPSRATCGRGEGELAGDPGPPARSRVTAGTGLGPGCRAPGCPGWPGGACRCWRDGRPRRMAARLACTAIPGGGSPPAAGPRCVACGGGRRSRIRLRQRRGRPKERARPWSVVAVAEKPGRTVLSGVRLARAGRGLPASAAPPRVPGYGPHRPGHLPPGPIGIYSPRTPSALLAVIQCRLAGRHRRSSLFLHDRCEITGVYRKCLVSEENWRRGS